MSVAAVIPVKPLTEGKSRLASILTNEQRQTLNKNMFNHVLKTTLSTPEVDEVLVISKDEVALTLAERAGAHAILEDKNSDLNAALSVARKASEALGVSSLIVVPADLARLEPTDLTAILNSRAGDAMATGFIVIAPDESQHGTNALYMQPIDSIAFAFGTNSFDKHRAAAIRAGCAVNIIARANLSFDVDNPEDLTQLDKIFWQI